jgi:hypothetical protein
MVVIYVTGWSSEMEDSEKMRYPAKETGGVVLAHAVQNWKLSEEILESVRQKVS